MDDPNSRQQIDELAELYLTSFVDHVPAQEQPDPEKAAAVEDENDAKESLLDGPAPIKLAPKLDDDSHPMLRLTEDEIEEYLAPTPQEVDRLVAAARNEPTQKDTPTVADPPAPRAHVEAVILGNLPGMAGPWLTQYAQLLAQTKGPVLLLHLDEQGIDLEIIEPRDEAEPAPATPPTAVRVPPMRRGMTGLVGLLDALATSQTTPAQTILVRINASTDAQTLSRLAALEDWTVLSGSDEASIAGISQQVRSLVHADPRLADRSVGVMVMGSEEAAAANAAKRIAHELEADLAHPVTLVGHLKRMQPVQVRELGSFPDPVALWPQLVSWFDLLQAPGPAPSPQPTPTPEPNDVQQPRPERAQAQQPVSTPKPQPRFQKTASKPPAPTPPVAQAGKPMRKVPQPRVIEALPELDLVGLLAQGPAALNDPTPLDARIPDQPKTQLAVDAEGIVHILLKVSDTISDADAVVELIEAGQWVRANLQLLALTQRDQSFVDADPVLHLLTDRADRANKRVGKLGEQVHLHLLEQVQIGQATGWFCTPLG